MPNTFFKWSLEYPIRHLLSPKKREKQEKENTKTKNPLCRLQEKYLFKIHQFIKYALTKFLIKVISSLDNSMGTKPTKALK